MTKPTAKVTTVLASGIHKIGTIEDGRPRSVMDLPLPTRVEIEIEGGREEPYIMRLGGLLNFYHRAAA